MSDKDLFKAVRQYEELGEVVTCGECKYYSPYEDEPSPFHRWGECQRLDCNDVVEMTDYCSKGVRKENK